MTKEKVWYVLVVAVLSIVVFVCAHRESSASVPVSARTVVIPLDGHPDQAL